MNSIEYLYEAWDFNRLTPEEELSYFLDFLENTINDLSVSNKRWAQETINEIRFILEYYENQRFLEEQGY